MVKSKPVYLQVLLINTIRRMNGKIIVITENQLANQ